LPALIDNWSRLGLVEVDYSRRLTETTSYDWVEQRPETVRLKKELETDTQKVTQQMGILVRTQFGTRFASAVGLL
jgi:hypothetical protein